MRLLESTADDCGGGGGNIPSNAIFAFVPNSASDDDPHVLSPAVALTSWSTTGSTTTVINTGTNGFSANQWVSMRFATSFPASPHGFTWYKVLSAGLSSTQFELDTTGVSPGTCSSTCGSAYNAMPYLPFATTGSPGMPTAAINNTYGSCGGTDPSSNACTLYGMETNYSTILHPISPAVTGVPGYLIVVGPNNDIGLNYTLANIKTYYQTLFSEAHTDGWVIAVLSPTGANFNQYGAPNAFANQVAIDTWLRGQGKTTVQATTPGSSQYWDIWSDVGSVDWDGGDTSIIATNTGYGPTGAKSAAVTLSSDIQTANGTVKPRRQLWWAGPVSGGSTGNNGYVFIPGTEPVATWRWMSADLTTTYAQLNHNTFSALNVFAGSINAGGCPGGRPFCTTGGFNIDCSNNLWAVNGILAGSGGSNLVCWNTNGGTTACGGGATVTAAPPYVEIGSTFYDHDFYAVTKPPVCASTTWLNSVTPSSCTNGTNGDVVIKTSSANQYWATQTATSSVEGVFSISSNTTATSNVSGGGIWIYDSTNSKVYLFQAVGTGNAEYILGFNSYNCTSPCSSTSPSGASGLFTWWGSGAYGVGGNAHLKLSVSGSTLTIAISLNGGVTFMTLATESVGTITKGGYAVNVSGTDTTMMDVQSILVQ